MLEPISKSRLSQSAVEAIKAYILNKELSSGAKLPSERELSEALDISRASVREALRILEIIGLIEVKPGSGIYFKDWTGDLSLPLKVWLPVNEETLREIFEVRLLIEPRAAGLAAERATPEIVEKMKECLEKFQHFSEINNLAGMILADTEFHKTVAKATCNKTLTILMNTMARYLPEGWKASLKVPERPEKTITEHNIIYQAIKDHDANLASKQMTFHLSSALDEILQVNQNKS